jgi:hypothetical protein
MPDVLVSVERQPRLAGEKTGWQRTGWAFDRVKAS